METVLTVNQRSLRGLVRDAKAIKFWGDGVSETPALGVYHGIDIKDYENLAL
jgi:hypothetical protein